MKSKRSKKSKKAKKKIKSKKTEKTPKKNQRDLKKIQKQVREVNKLFMTLGFYPVAVDQVKKDETRAEIVKRYLSGNTNLRHNILHLIYENLTQYSDYKVPMNYGFFKSKHPQEAPEKLKFAVYKTMFNYLSSIEGSLDLLSMLKEFDDVASAKLLTHLFNYFSINDSERFRILRNSIIDCLGDHNSPYALKTLLEYVNFVDSEKLFQRVLDSIVKWNDKLDKLPISKNDKKELKKSLDGFLNVMKNE